MKNTIQVIEFLRTGVFDSTGILFYGMTREALVGSLGDTDWKFCATRKSKFPGILKYGKVEFYFEEEAKGRLYGVVIQLAIEPSEQQGFPVDYTWLSSELSLSEAQQHLTAESIDFELEVDPSDPYDDPVIHTQGQVKLIFSKVLEQKEKLQKVGKFIELNNRRSKTKQVSFYLPDTFYEKLRAKAIAERKSIANLCRELVLEQLSTSEGSD